MCLGIPGQIVAVTDATRMMAMAEVSGVRREVNVACIAPGDDPLEALIGKWTLIHVGFAMSLIDEDEAAKTLEALHGLGETQEAGGWVDITRADIPDGQLYSWWSYRAKDWDAADKGRRLDHVWATRDIANAGHSSRILRDARGWEQPSDHAPVFATFDL